MTPHPVIAPNPDPPTVVLVEDEPVLRMTFREFLEEEGLRVVACESYDAAIAALERVRPDVVVTDIVLGRETGIDLLRHANALGHACEVVVMTGDPRLDSAAEAVRLGAFDYLIKPVPGAELKRVVRLALDRRRITSERDAFRAELEALFESVDAGIFTLDTDLRIHHVNAAARSMFALDDETHSPTLDALPIQDSDSLHKACLAAVADGARTRDIRLQTQAAAGPPQRALIANVAPLGRPSRGASVVVRDITRLTFLEAEVARSQRFHSLVGGSGPMRDVYRLIEDLAHADSTVLICGESGTGKELIAEAIHRSSSRSSKPLVRVNCSALAEELLESELFGHVKGAFTGAVKDREGRFEAANGGTLFLDEIGDISPRLQLRLLRALQQGEFERVGDSRTIKVDVRIVAATNQNLAARIEDGKFREDLYYRLNVIRIDVPPLRERAEDIPLLADHFVRHFNTKFGREIAGVSADAMSRLMAHSWRGNVRELENCIERAFIVCHDTEIRPEHLPREIAAAARAPAIPQKTPVPGSVVESAVTRDTVIAALTSTDWNVAKAARLLGIARNTLYEKMKRLSIDRPARF